MNAKLPAAAAPFAAFARLLRDEGFAVATSETIDFLAGIRLLGPRSLRDVYWAARAMLAPPPDRTAEFDALFDAFFADAGGVAAVAMDGEEDTPVSEAGAGDVAPLLPEDGGKESGEQASAAETLSARRLDPREDDARLALMQARLAAAAPSRRGFRRTGARRGDRLDLRRHLRRIVRDGEAADRPMWTRRAETPRRVLLLLDISGSMKRQTDACLRFAHAVTRARSRVETFTFGTRLSRLTRALRHRSYARAAAEIAAAVPDFDGGTRIGENLARLLAVPRFARASRGALVVVVSDGLERGDPTLMAAAVRRLAMRAWRLAWLTPLAADPRFRPETAGLKAILPVVDRLGDGGSIAALCRFMEDSDSLGASRAAAGRETRRHGDHRRPPSHLAAGGPALARRPDGAAHLRTL